MILRVARAAWNACAVRLYPIEYARRLGVRVGARCRFIDLDPGAFGSEPYLIEIGDHVTLTAGVRFVTHDGGVWVFRDSHPEIDVFGPIRVGSNVFIGMGTIVLPGVEIGSDCVIGAGSVVSRSIPANSVAAGVPARRLGSLEEYWKRVARKAVHVRGLGAGEKRERLLEWFGDAERT